MNFLAGESRGGPVIRALREAGHDVVAIAEVRPRAYTNSPKSRSSVMSTRFSFRARSRTCSSVAPFATSGGVILVRFHSRARLAKPTTVVEAVAKLGPRLRDSFAVIEAGRVRISSRP